MNRGQQTYLSFILMCQSILRQLLRELWDELWHNLHFSSFGRVLLLSSMASFYASSRDSALVLEPAAGSYFTSRCWMWCWTSGDTCVHSVPAVVFGRQMEMVKTTAADSQQLIVTVVACSMSKVPTRLVSCLWKPVCKVADTSLEHALLSLLWVDAQIAWD